MKTTLIVDKAFRHAKSSCLDRVPADFRWKWLDPEDGFHFPGEVVFFTDGSLHLAKFYSGCKKVGWLIEPREVQPEIYDSVENWADDFETILTFDRGLIATNPQKFRFYPFGGCWIDDSDIRSYPKNKRCSIIASAKAVTEGQRLRHEVIRRFGDRLEVFGGGYRPVDNKLEALKDFEFTIVIENSRQADYFSEKIIDAFATGTTPLYWGTDQIADYFPTGVLPFNSLDELESLLDSATSDPVAIAENLDRLENYKLPEDWIWKQYPDLFSAASSSMSQPSRKISDYLSGGARFQEQLAKVESKLANALEQRDKARAERERYREERDRVREERNLARAERDQAKMGARGVEKPPPPQFFLDDREELLKQSEQSDHHFDFAKDIPIDERNETNHANGHYFYQDLWVAQRIFQTSPEKHVDIASRVDGFVTNVASFREIEVFDIRDVPTCDPNIKFQIADLMDLDESLVDYTDSLSCLHAIEHFGLGRYGDPINFEGHLDGIANMTKIVKSGGRFFFSTPIGPQCIHFNAHRVFSVRYLLDIFDKDFELGGFSWVGDDGEIRRDVEMTEEDISDNFGCHYGCGIFEWIKR